MKLIHISNCRSKSMVRRVLISLIITASLFSLLNMVAFAVYDTDSKTYGIYEAVATLSWIPSRTRYTFDCDLTSEYLNAAGQATEEQNNGAGVITISIGGSGYHAIGQSYYPNSGYGFVSAYANYTTMHFATMHLPKNS